MNDLPLSEMTMNAKMFRRDNLDPDLSALVSEVVDNAMSFYLTDPPFKQERTFTMKVRCKHPAFGLELSTNRLFQRV